MKKKIDQAEIYAEINSIAGKNGIVFLGADFFYELPVNELRDVFGITGNIINRSLKGMTVEAAEKILDVSIFDLEPAKVFLNIGDADIADKEFDAGHFLSKYEWLLYMIHNKIKTKIHIVSIASEDPPAARVNKGLKELAEKCGCVFIDIVPALSCDKPVLRVFDIMKFYLRSDPITFYDSMNNISV